MNQDNLIPFWLKIAVAAFPFLLFFALKYPSETLSETFPQSLSQFETYELSTKQMQLLSLELNGFTGVTLLTFWEEWCEACKKELRSLAKSIKKQKTNLKVITVHLNNKEAKAKLLLKKMGLKSQQVNDNSEKWKKTFQIKQIPTSMLIKDNHVKFKSKKTVLWNIEKLKALSNL